MGASGYSEPKSDARKPKEKKVLLGQVMTPSDICHQMIAYLSELINQNMEDVKILDPCVGLGAFPEALLECGHNFPVKCLDIDPEMIEQCEKRLGGHSDLIEIEQCDYLLENLVPNHHNAVIANPPYVRHEWLKKKNEYQQFFEEKFGKKIPGTSNLYVYFIVKMIEELPPKGAFCFVVYDSWRNTRFGKWLIDYLNSSCALIEHEILEGGPFKGHLIDSTIIYGLKGNSGGTPEIPLEIKSRSFFEEISGFSKVGDEYVTKRGLRLKQASFFLGDKVDVEKHGAIIFAKKPNKIPGLTLNDSHDESLLLILDDEDEPQSRVMNELQNRLIAAQSTPEKNEPILNWQKKRPDHWYRHASPPVYPLIFNYYIRSNPRVILNKTDIPFSDNFYGIKPKEMNKPIEFFFALFNSSFAILEYLSSGRKQGNGLTKLQLFEFRDCWIPSHLRFDEAGVRKLSLLGRELETLDFADPEIIEQIDDVIIDQLGAENGHLKEAVYDKLNFLGVRISAG